MMIYLASPYTHPDVLVRDYRYQAVHKYTYHCMQLGEIIFSPIVYGHEFVQYDERVITAAYWQSFNDHMLTTSDSMRVLMLPGWCQSKGVAAELALANRLTIPIEYVTFEVRNEGAHQ